jgi:short-subunit dehydrogenase
MALCPGVTNTNFFDAAKIQRPPARIAQTPEAVVETALRGLARGKGSVISGWTNLMMVQAERLTPRAIVVRIAGTMLRKTIGVKE